MNRRTGPAGERAAGERAAGERAAGERAAGERAAGEPEAGEPTAVEPAVGEPEADEPAEAALATAAATMPLAPVVPFVPGFVQRHDGPAVPAVPVPAQSPAEVASQRLRLAAAPVRALLAGLSEDPRLPAWIRRTIGSVVVGTVLAILVNWWFGIAAAVVAAAADALYCTRTSAVIPAAVRAASATRRTRRRLDREAPAGYLGLHTRLIPGSGSVVDHLVVGPAGVYAVTSQRWDRRLPVRWTHGDRLFHGPFDQSGVLDQTRWQASQAARLIGDTFGQPVTVRPAMVIYGPMVPWAVVTIGGVDVFCGRKLRKYLRRETSANRARRMDERRIELIHAVASQVLPPAR